NPNASGLARGRTPVAATIGRWLIGDTRMVGAIRQTRDRIAAAEEELGAAGIADRPAAGLLGQFQNGAALANRDNVLDELRNNLGLDLVGVHESGIASDGAASDPH